MFEEKPKTTVILADDHPIFRAGLRQIIENSPDFEVFADVGDGDAALAALTEHSPDLVLLDLDMPKRNGLEVAQELSRTDTAPPVMILTMHRGEDLFNAAMDAGVKGYVLKDCVADDLLSGLEAIRDGRTYISPTISEYLYTRLKRSQGLEKERPGLAQLTPAERRVLKNVSDNLTSKEIASKLGISARTVETHRANICAKLDLHGAHSLVKFAFDNRASL